MHLSIVTVEYQDLLSLSKLVSSIINNIKNVEYEIIVISNSNYDKDKQKEINNNFPIVKCIFNSDNKGFSKAVNQALSLSSGKYVLIINPDAVLLDQNIASALSFLENNPKVCAVGPRVIDDSGEIQDSLRVFVSPKTLIWRTFKRGISKLFNKNKIQVLEYEQYSFPHPVDWISGACMLVKKSAIADVGPMDERFFMYCEDMDWCRRFWQHHYEVWSFPHWTVQHNATRASTSNVFAINKLKIIHIISMLKYFWKWSFNKT